MKKRRGERENRILLREFGTEITVHQDLFSRQRPNKAQRKLAGELEQEATELGDYKSGSETRVQFEATIEILIGEKTYDLIARTASREYRRKAFYDCEFYPCECGEKSAQICATRNYRGCEERKRLLAAQEKTELAQD